jgi:hypothetical protein
MTRDGSVGIPSRIAFRAGAVANRRVRTLLAALVVAFLPFSAVRATGPDPIAAADALTLSNVRVEVKTADIGSYKGNRYLRIHFTATPNESIPPKMNVRIRGVAKAGGQVLTDEISSLGALEKLPVGQAKNNFSPLFMSKGLPAVPESCELTFWLVRILEKRGSNLGTFCWNGNSVRPGPCRE